MKATRIKTKSTKGKDMTKTNTAKTVIRAKEQAKRIKKNMKLQTMGAALNELSKINGYRNWNAYKTKLIDDSPVKGETIYTLKANEQAFRCAGIITEAKVEDINSLVEWFNVNFPYSEDIAFFEDKKKLVELMDNDHKNKTSKVYAYIAFEGLKHIDSLMKSEMKGIEFNEFVEKYTKDLDKIDFSDTKDFLVTVNKKARQKFPDVIKGFSIE